MRKLQVKAHEKHRANTAHCLTAFATYAQPKQLANIMFDHLETRTTHSSVLDLGSWFGMVNDASDLLFMKVQEVVVPGYGWRKGEASRFNRGGGERLRSHKSRVWDSDDHVTSTTSEWFTLSTPRTASWMRRRHIELGDFFWKKKTESAISSCSLSFVVVSLVEKHIVIAEH